MSGALSEIVKCQTCSGHGRAAAMVHTKLESYLDFIDCPDCNGKGYVPTAVRPLTFGRYDYCMAC